MNAKTRRRIDIRRPALPWKRPSRAAPVEGDLNELAPEDRAIVEQALPFTMTGILRLQSLVNAVRYCARRDLPGAFAECGVWRGGSVLAMILTLQSLGCSDRDIYLFDTFEGMTEPTEHDVSSFDGAALDEWKAAGDRSERAWSEVFAAEGFDEESVRQTLLSTGYPRERVHLVRGPVEDTIPASAPDRLALLRLDTDWYESTRHELEHLYPRLSDGGVLIIDDYGHWDGARRAVDEYFEADVPPVLLNRIDYTGRIAIKH
jgi:hypothetical protein